MSPPTPGGCRWAPITTPEFAVATIRAWWRTTGSGAYPAARRRLLTCADGGGFNGYRTRLWKTEPAALADQTGLEITVCHLPPGTSKCYTLIPERPRAPTC